jgi:myosin-1
MGDTLCLLFLSRARVVSIIFSGNPRRSARRRPATAATQFKISLGALLNNLGTKMPHYVRCLKANDAKQPKLFDSSLVKHQVTYQG